jgi:hypothetical protein
MKGEVMNRTKLMWVALAVSLAVCMVPTVAIGRTAASYRHTIALLRSSVAAHDRLVARLDAKVTEWRTLDEYGTVSLVDGAWYLTSAPRLLCDGWRSVSDLGLSEGQSVHIVGNADSTYSWPLALHRNFYVNEFEVLR